jgi:hypothetical protein
MYLTADALSMPIIKKTNTDKFFSAFCIYGKAINISNDATSTAP